MHILITGGAGFIGCNLAHRFLGQGKEVIVLDSLARQGVERNLDWLRESNNGRLEYVHADVRDAEAVRRAVARADIVYHLAAQVAVTTSVEDPQSDFEVNAMGTLNVLEAARLAGHKPIVFFTSTNKVYGGMEDVAIVEEETRYRYEEYPQGISEDRGLDFHSPYGCSKGAADQYVRDYARIYDLPTVVFRMSCIYGPRQFGTEDQGWVAYFAIASLLGWPITIYGDGKQVRDILFVDDLVRAFERATDEIDTTRGQVYNIGGGHENTISVWVEFREVLRSLLNRDVSVTSSDWRPGDQLVYVSDVARAQNDFGWHPQVDVEQGISRLVAWVDDHRHLFP